MPPNIPAYSAIASRDREQHDVADGGAGDAELHEQRAILAAADRVAIDAAVRVHGMSETIEQARDRRQPDARRIEDDIGARPADVEAQLDDAVEHGGQPLGQPNAGGAANLLEVERDLGEPVVAAAHVQRVEAGIVELVVALAGGACRRQIVAGDAVVAVEPVLGERGEHDLAPGAAEPRARRRAEPAMRAARRLARRGGHVARGDGRHRVRGEAPGRDHVPPP
jgi:hypothetical protein